MNLTPVAAGTDVICHQDFCLAKAGIFLCQDCAHYFCEPHKDHECTTPRGLAPRTDRACKCCNLTIDSTDWKAALITIQLKSGSKFSFWRCGECETQVQKMRSNTPDARLQTERR